MACVNALGTNSLDPVEQELVKHWSIIVLYEKYSILGYNEVQSSESQPVFPKNMLLPSSGLKSKPTKKPA
jgi:hypothetical protein